jgi:hypothetical protein
LVTTLPAESSTFTTGWVVNAVVALELATPFVWVLKTNVVAAPKVTVKVVLVAEVRPLVLALRV